jgi:signal transduction histidine kinase
MVSQTSNADTVIDALYRISSLVAKTEDPHKALQSILGEIVNILQPTSASICLINPDSKRLEVEVSFGLPSDAVEFDLPMGRGITGWVALHGKPLLVPDVRLEPRYISVNPAIRSEMAVPMEERGGVIGVVNVDSDRVKAFDGKDLKLLTLLTNEATKMVSRLWLIRQLRAKASQLEALVNMGQRIVSKETDREVLVSITEEAKNLTAAHICALLMLNPDRQSLRLHTVSGPQGLIPYDEDLPLEDSSVGAAILRQKQVEVYDLAFTEEHHFTRLTRKEGLVSMLSSPIIFDGDAIGVLNAYTTVPHRFNNDEKKVFATLASLGAVAIQNARLYKRLFTSEETLRRNEKLTTLGLLAAEIAHEIRNPLTVIKLLYESLELRFDHNDERSKDVEIISEKLDQLEDIVGRVLDFGKSNQGLHARYDLNRLVDETIQLVRLKLKQQQIGIQIERLEKDLLVDVNKGQIQQVLLNLILNATQAMPGGGNVCIKTGLSEADNYGNIAAFCEISDSGQGMPAEVQKSIFESFLSHRPGGTGLGLSISKRILKSHRGDIQLVRSDETGTVFRFQIPRVQLQE